MKILAVDDQPLILKSIEKKLTKAGYEIGLATDGQEAIDAYDNDRPDLIILDLEMPNTNGFAVIDHIRTIKKDDLPIIVMSGNDDENTVVDTFKLGVNDYIEKPVGLNELLARVQRQLQQTVQSKDFKSDATSQVIQKNLVGVVIPCYNEEERLRTNEFTSFVNGNLGYHLCFVNDGSTDNTLKVLQELSKGREDHISVYDCAKNGGKAEAVRQGVLHLSKDKQLDYIGFLDADLSTNFQDFDDLVKTISDSDSDFKIVSGSRIARMGADIHKEGARAIISKTINKIIQTILGMPFRDTQCGAKIMTKDVIEKVFDKRFYTKWLFDVEIFLRMKKVYGADKAKSYLCEQPLKRWVHEDGSKLSMKDSVKILGQLFQLAVQYR